MALARARHGRLPTPQTPLVGRAEDIEAAKRLVLETRLVTLTGAGGSGKTRLAIAVAEALSEHYSDGVVFVALQDAGDREAVLSAMSSALGLVEYPDRDIESAIADYLAGHEALLVLDNFEQVISEATLVSDLMAEAPSVDVLVTSRIPLRLSGEHELVVLPLEVPGDPATVDLADLLGNDAIVLFIERSRAVRPDLELGPDEVRAIAEIARRLDGIPLAIELAAARTASLPPPSSSSAWGTGCSSCDAAGGPAPRGTGRCGPPSSGPTTCSSRRTGRSCLGCRCSLGRSAGDVGLADALVRRSPPRSPCVGRARSGTGPSGSWR